MQGIKLKYFKYGIYATLSDLENRAKECIADGGKGYPFPVEAVQRATGVLYAVEAIRRDLDT